MQPHLRGLGLENFRVFADYQWFDFAPITILTGPNSSGKSSVLKALLLLSDNLNRNDLLTTTKDIADNRSKKMKFDGEHYDLSSGGNIRNNKSTSGELLFHLPYKVELPRIKDINLLLEINLVLEETKTLISNSIKILTSEGKIIFHLKSNYLYFDYNEFMKLIFPFLESRKKHPKLSNSKLSSRGDIGVVHNNLVKLENLANWQDDLIEIKYEKYKEYLDEDNYENVDELSENYMYYFMNRLLTKNVDEKLEKKTLDKISSAIFSIIGLKSVFYEEREYSKNFTDYFSIIKDCNYLPSLKGTVQRSYRSIDSDTLNQLLKRLSNSNLDKKQENFKNDWATEFKLKSLEYFRLDEMDRSYFEVDNQLLPDLGFGISQLVAIIIQQVVCGYGGNQLLLFEEPEANLHPKFQSQLADLFLDAQSKFGNQFIIETHSEYMIRKFQYLVAKGKERGGMDPKDVVIYYLHDPNDIPEGEKQVKKIEILSDGSLSDDFGPGFFDEAANWELELLRLKKNRIRQN